MKTTAIVVACVATAIACGCAAAPVPVPVARIEASEAAIRQADEMGAARDRQAAIYLSLARAELDHAKALVDVRDNERAQRVIEKALADADLAMALVRERAARRMAQQTQQEARAIAGASREP